MTPHDSFVVSAFFFFNDTATTEIYTLSLHDALPISRPAARDDPGARAARGDRPGGLGAHRPGDRAAHGGAAGGAARAPGRARVVGRRRGGARRGVGPARDRRVPRHAGRPADPLPGGHAPGG